MKNLTKNILKISIIAILIILAYRIWIFFINANNNSTNNLPSNQKNFKKIHSSEMWKTWVAISTNIWIKYSEKKPLSPIIYQELFSIEELKKDKSKAENAIITKNMLEIKEYYSLLKTDFKSIIKESSDKKATFKWVYNQLSIRYKNTIESIKILEKQKNIFTSEYNKLENNINNIKSKINSDYKKWDPEAINEDISKLLSLRQDFNYVRTYIIFINNFLGNYQALNNYNGTLLNALSLNKDAIEKWSYIVLPDSGKEILKDYGLLYTEDEYNKTIKNRE